MASIKFCLHFFPPKKKGSKALSDLHFELKPSFNQIYRIFKSNKGILINADVNAAYQIIKAGGYKDISIKENESVTRLNVA